MSACLAPDTVLGFVAGDVNQRARARVESHLDDCPACMAVVARMAVMTTPGRSPLRSGAAQPSSPGGRLPLPLPLLPGQKIDHYIVRDVIGVGGMGVVYS